MILKAKIRPAASSNPPCVLADGNNGRKCKRAMLASARAATRRRLLLKYGPKSPPGKASRFIRRLKPYHKKHPGMAVVIYIRVSSGPQEDRGNFDTYEWKLRRVCARLGIPVIAVFRAVRPGWILNDARDRLIAAVACARQYEADAGKHTVVLAPSTDRFLRNIWYHSVEYPDLTPTEAEFRMLRELTGGIRLVTYLHPDMPPRKVRSWQTKWGQRYKGRKGGGDRMPGSRKRRKARLQPEACRLRRQGRSYREIKKRLGVSLRTAWEWAKCA